MVNQERILFLFHDGQ